MAGIYSAPSYQMGAVTQGEAVRAQQELAQMKRSLQSWLKDRAVMDAAAAGLVKTTKGPAPSEALLRQRRHAREQELATQLYHLLSEVFSPESLPNPDVARNPSAAVALAKIAISGRLPAETSSPEAAGVVWLWPVAIVVAGAAFVITSAIRNSADVARERERLECIKIGACTDYGFWLRLGGAAIVGWFIWDKLGVGARLQRAIKGGSSG